MPTRFFDVPIIPTGIAYGLAGLTDRQRQLEEEAKRRKAARKAQQKKNLILGVGAGVGAVGGLALAPALGLGGSALAGSTVGAGLPGAGIASVAATSLTGAGALIGGLGGAAIGATAASRFGEGDIAGGISSIASPIIGSLERQEARRLQLSDREALRAGNLADALTLDRSRTDENIRQAQEVSTIPRYGMPYSQVSQAAQEQYEASVAGAPSAGQALELPDEFVSEPAYGPFNYGEPTQGEPLPNRPGPSPIPGMKRDFTIQDYFEKAKIENERANTVDNPIWRQHNTTEARNAAYQALARRADDIRVKTMPAPPTMEQRVQQETFTDPKTGVLWHTKDVSPTLPSKAQEGRAPWLDEPDPVKADAMKLEHFNATRIIQPDADGTPTEYLWSEKDRGWDPTKPGKADGDDADYAKEWDAAYQFVAAKVAPKKPTLGQVQERVLERRKGILDLQLTTERGVSSDELAAFAEAIVTTANDLERHAEATGQSMTSQALLALQGIQKRYPDPASMPPTVRTAYGRLARLAGVGP